LVGKLIMWMASKGHFFGQIPVLPISPDTRVGFLALEHTTSDTQALRDESNLGGRLDFDTQLASFYDRTTSLALWLSLLVFRSLTASQGLNTLTTFLWLALVAIDDGNTGELVRHGEGWCTKAVRVGERAVIIVNAVSN